VFKPAYSREVKGVEQISRIQADLSYSGMRIYPSPVEFDGLKLDRSSTCTVSSKTDHVFDLAHFLSSLFVNAYSDSKFYFYISTAPDI